MRFYSVQLDDRCVGIFSTLTKAEDYIWTFRMNFPNETGEHFIIYESSVDDYGLAKKLSRLPFLLSHEPSPHDEAEKCNHK